MTKISRARPGLECTPEEDRTRQEVKDEVNVNNIIRNLTGLPLRAVAYGEVDFDALDRHQVENQLIEAKAVYASLTPDQRRAIPSVAHLIQMASDGYQPPKVGDDGANATIPEMREALKSSSKEDKAGEKPA